MIDTSPKPEKRFVGIVNLDPAEERPGVVRLGPPPGNADILLNAGMGWLFGVRNHDPVPSSRLTRLDRPPDSNEVSVAFAREMAWRWFQGRDPFVTLPSHREKGVPQTFRGQVPYADLERGFVSQAMGLIPKMAPPDFTSVPVIRSEAGNLCACVKGSTGCASNGSACKED